MLQLKLFIRTFFSRKKNNLFGVAGLSIGICVAMLIGWWAYGEFSFDTFHEDYEDIYRLTLKANLNGEDVILGSTFGPAKGEILESCPEIEEGVRIVFDSGKRAIDIDGKKTLGTNIAYADSSFFSFFTFPFYAGDPKTCLQEPNSIVVTKSFAIKHFGVDNPIGRDLKMWDEDYVVSAVIEDVPSNSHMTFNGVTAMHGSEEMDKMGWGNHDNFFTFFKVSQSVNIEDLEKKITKITDDAFWGEVNVETSQNLQPLSDIHFQKGHRFDPAIVSNKSVIIMVLLMAIAILIIACINFTNLFISNGLLRAKSIGVRKTSGATRAMLISEFYFETALYTFISVVIATIAAVLFMPLFNKLINGNVAFDFTLLPFYLLIFGISIVTIVVSGTFPALYITSYNPVESLKGKLQGRSVNTIQKTLVIIQYVASIVLIISVFTIKKQVSYFQNMDLGFTTSDVIYIDMNDNIASSIDVVKNQLKANPNVKGFSIKNGAPHEWRQGQGISTPDNPEKEIIMEVCQTDDAYFDMLDINLVDGMYLTNFHDSLNCVLLNETAVSQLGLTNPIGKEIIIWDESFVVKGIVKNIKSKSLHNVPDAQVYTKLGSVRGWYTLMLRTNGNNKAVVELLEELWNTHSPDALFEYNFLDKTYSQMYETEQRVGKMVSVGAIIALLLTALGLIALVRFTMQRRMKEIAVRKVNGSTISALVAKLSKSFLIWVGISFVIAIPIAYYLMKNWLEGFAFHINLGPSIFILSGIIITIIAALTVGWQTYNAANVNPAKILKDE